MENKLFLVLGATVLLAGCRTATHVRDIPRVDLELSGGNRGYLIGNAPEGTELKTTRQILETNVEIPSYYRPKPGATLPHNQAGNDMNTHAGAGFDTDDVGTSQEAATVTVSAETGPMDTYVVQKNDTLSGIAARPQIYGKASKWKRILDANHDLLKGNPNHIRVGMKLKIPRGQSGSEPALSGKDSGGTSFSK